MSNRPTKNTERDLAPLEKGADKFIGPFQGFFRKEISGGILLFVATVAALIFANSELAQYYAVLVDVPIALSIGSWRVEHSFVYWVNDFLMVLFFFLIGLEVKRELIAGELRDLSQARLVIFMAIGGMIIPAIIYASVVGGGEGGRGWGIPMATDTAFALAAITLLGTRVPKSVAIVLSALAIVDDIGAVLVIAIFYSKTIQIWPLILAASCFLVLLTLNRAGFRRPASYLFFGLIIWICMKEAGIHPTTAGILIALTVPSKPFLKSHGFLRQLKQIMRRFEKQFNKKSSIIEQGEQHKLVEEVQQVAVATTTSLQHWESILERPILLCVIPLFAFLNAGVAFPDSLSEIINAPVSVAIILALILGKSIGISLFAWLSVKLGIASFPNQVGLREISGMSFLAGIGFTMSLFIADLAFSSMPDTLAQAKIGILIGSTVSCLIGLSILIKKPERNDVYRNK